MSLFTDSVEPKTRDGDIVKNLKLQQKQINVLITGGCDVVADDDEDDCFMKCCHWVI